MNHNKKRNVGIIYELLVRAVSAYLVENNRDRAQNALDIISKFYNKNTELYREFRLFNALAKSSVGDTSIAAAILTESKNASRRFDSKKLIKEKSELIREINYTLADVNFYHRKVPSYRTYATIQNLLNAWAEGDRSNLTEMVLLETKMIEWLTTPREEEAVSFEETHNVDSLVVKIMNEKFNEKYSTSLTNDQKTLIKEYVFSIENDGGISIKTRALEIQANALREIASIRKSERNPIILEKIDAVETLVKEADFMSIDDDKIIKLMTLTQLINEMKEK